MIEKHISKRTLEKLAGLTELIDNKGTDRDALNMAIQEEIAKRMAEGKYDSVSDPGLFGPHTTLKGWALPRMLNHIGSLLGITKDSPRDTMIYSGNNESTEDLIDSMLLSSKFYKKKDPDIIEKVKDTIGAHEILEAEALEKDPNAMDLPSAYMFGPAQLGGLLGGALGASTLRGTLAPALRGAGLKNKLIGGLIGAYSGFGLGALAGIPLSAIASIGSKNDMWSSHMSADIPRLESRMLAIMNDPNITDIFKSMRLQTGERKAFQNANVDIGDLIPRSKLKKIQDQIPLPF